MNRDGVSLISQQARNLRKGRSLSLAIKIIIVLVLHSPINF